MQVWLWCVRLEGCSAFYVPMVQCDALPGRQAYNGRDIAPCIPSCHAAPRPSGSPIATEWQLYLLTLVTNMGDLEAIAECTSGDAACLRCAWSLQREHATQSYAQNDTHGAHPDLAEPASPQGTGRAGMHGAC